jgi:hypothetical protein
MYRLAAITQLRYLVPDEVSTSSCYLASDRLCLKKENRKQQKKESNKRKKAQKKTIERRQKQRKQ